MFRLTVVHGSQSETVEVPEAATLLEGLAFAAHIGGYAAHVDSPCGGRGTCGKCLVRVVCGDAGPVSADEKLLLGQEALERGMRLACLARPEGCVTVELPCADAQRGKEAQGATGVLAQGRLPDFELDPPALRACRGADSDASSCRFGAAIDIGTTTVACWLVDLATGAVVARSSAINPQRVYGADVLSRITYQLEHGQDAIDRLQESIVACLNALILQAADEADVATSQVAEVCVAANCTMMHMLLGADARPLGKAPFTPAFQGAQMRQTSDVGLSCAPGAQLYCLPGVSAFIGADIVAGCRVCGLAEKSRPTMFIDIGTNGEIVLTDGQKMLSCSCAAGPALEGMNISCGMQAQEGALQDVALTCDSARLDVIGDVPAQGICGSGVLAMTSELVRTGLVGPRGAFIKRTDLAPDDWRSAYLRENGTKREMVVEQPEGDVVFTQGDVRQVQLAKGAILSGFMALVEKAQLDAAQLDEVIIAGQFGAHLSERHLIGAGIVPPEVRGRMSYAGNTSLTGAYLALVSAKERAAIEQLAQKINYFELGQYEGYERLFANCLIFPEEGSVG